MGRQDAIKIIPEVIAALQKQAEATAAAGASIDEVMTAADKVRQTFLDAYAKESIKNIKP
jgi:hypothetical protein